MKRTVAFVLTMLVSTLVFPTLNVVSTETHFQCDDFHDTLLKLDTNPSLDISERILSTSQREENGYRIVEEIVQQWYEGAWINFRKYTYSYNSDDLLIEKGFDMWENYQWALFSKTLYTYNDDGTILEILDTAYIDDEWINCSRFLHYYNNGLLTEKMYQYWVDSEWEISCRFTFTYDNGHCVEELYEVWEDSQWNYFYKLNYTYDVNNNIIEEIKQLFENDEWIYNVRDMYTYGNEGILINGIREVWDNDIWNLYSNIIYTYDDFSNLIEKRELAWNDGWVQNCLDTYTYDDSQNQTEWLHQSYPSWQFINVFRYTNVFDANNNRITQCYETWESGQWVYNNKRLYSYEQYTESPELIIPQTQITNYPNPFNPSTTIKLELAEAGKIELAIYNIKGQKVKTLMDCTTAPGTYKCNWNGKDESGKPVSSGQYIVKLQQNSEETVKKIMLLK